jgi:hypothetical protein
MQSRVRQSGRQVYRMIAGEHLLVDMHAKSDVPFYALTSTGAELWKMLVEWRDEEELAGFLQQRYGIAGEQAAADVRDFVEQLESIGAIERVTEHS